MEKAGFYARILLSHLALISCIGCSLLDPGKTGELSILTYNVENLFDDVDQGTEYSDYDPGNGSWDTENYHAKLQNIAEAIRLSVAGGPDIILMQELENLNVLLALKETYLAGLGYRYYAITEDRLSATHVAYLGRYPPQRTTAMDLQFGEEDHLRGMLEIEFDTGADTLILINCHWKSKSGGAENTEQMRLEAAALAGNRIRELLARSDSSAIVLAGDLNEDLNEYINIDREYQTALVPLGEGMDLTQPGKSIMITSDPSQIGVRGELLTLYSPWYEWGHSGSYAYRGEWEKIDHFLLTQGFFDGSGVEVSTFSVVNSDLLLNRGGFPKRWNGESSSGYSDHLPLLLVLQGVR